MIHIHENFDLKGLNTFGIAALARYYVKLESLEDFWELMARPEYQQSSKLILGGGSNMLFGGDFTGMVIHVGFQGVGLENCDEEHCRVRSMAGEVWDDVVAFCVDKGLSGMENLSLIPGQVGASPIQNIGAYGCELKDVFYSLEAIDLQSGEIRSFSKDACRFGYRDSIFKNELKGKYLIYSVTFELKRNPEYKVNYGSLKEQLKLMGVEEVSLQHIRDAVIGVRRSKLPDPEELGNAGSFFKNPVVSLKEYEDLKLQYPDVVAFPESESRVKLAAGWLIERAGWKGFRRGDAGVHQFQALVLVNYGTASGSDIVNLAADIKADVKKRFGVELEQEVNLIKE